MTRILAPLVLLLAACVSIDYDLAQVPFPVSAKPAPAEVGPTEPFQIEASHVLWVHGLAGRTTPDVAQMVIDAGAGSSGVYDLRVVQRTNIHHWLLTHLSLGFVRMRRVVVEGSVVRDG